MLSQFLSLSFLLQFFETIESKELILDVVDMYCQLVSDPNNSLNFKVHACVCIFKSTFFNDYCLLLE